MLSVFDLNLTAYSFLIIAFHTDQYIQYNHTPFLLMSYSKRRETKKGMKIDTFNPQHVLSPLHCISATAEGLGGGGGGRGGGGGGGEGREEGVG